MLFGRADSNKVLVHFPRRRFEFRKETKGFLRRKMLTKLGPSPKQTWRTCSINGVAVPLLPLKSRFQPRKTLDRVLVISGHCKGIGDYTTTDVHLRLFSWYHWSDERNSIRTFVQQAARSVAERLPSNISTISGYMNIDWSTTSICKQKLFSREGQLGNKYNSSWCENPRISIPRRSRSQSSASRSEFCIRKFDGWACWTHFRVACDPLLSWMAGRTGADGTSCSQNPPLVPPVLSGCIVSPGRWGFGWQIARHASHLPPVFAGWVLLQVPLDNHRCGVHVPLQGRSTLVPCHCWAWLSTRQMPLCVPVPTRGSLWVAGQAWRLLLGTCEVPWNVRCIWLYNGPSWAQLHS